MRKRDLLFFALCAGVAFFTSCSDSSNSSSSFENVDGDVSSSETVAASSSGVPHLDWDPGISNGDAEQKSSSSVTTTSSTDSKHLNVPNLCTGKMNGMSVQDSNGDSYVCYEGATAISVATYDDLPECEYYYLGVVAYLQDDKDAYTCDDTDMKWRFGVLKVDLNPVQIVDGGACPDSLAGKEKFSKELNASFACLNGVWVMTKDFTPSSSSMRTPVPVDYSKGRAMNEKIGKGINFGNSWDAVGSGDGGWSNPIDDGDFDVIKKAGFNSVRIPVRWNAKNSSDMVAIKADVQRAIDLGLVVIVDYHHYDALNDIGNKYAKDPAIYKSQFESEKQNFVNKWKEVARELDQFPDDMLILEVWNEPIIASAGIVDSLMRTGYDAIRSVTKTKTIMFEAYHAAKFYDLDKLNLPEDGNIIYSGHYYEPFQFTHQNHGYDCKGDATYQNTAAKDMKEYAEQAKMLYPDVDGIHSIPLNMGEFGASSCASTAKRAEWAKLTVQAAEENDISWNYWCFKKCGGFEAWNGSWMSGFLDAFGL